MNTLYKILNYVLIFFVSLETTIVIMCALFILGLINYSSFTIPITQIAFAYITMVLVYEYMEILEGKYEKGLY